MQICSACRAQLKDHIEYCPKCNLPLSEYSSTTVTLQRLHENPRVNNVRIAVSIDACPACKQVQGMYPKDKAPVLPIEGCSHSNSCRCFYQPILEEIYP